MARLPWESSARSLPQPFPTFPHPSRGHTGLKRQTKRRHFLHAARSLGCRLRWSLKAAVRLSSQKPPTGRYFFGSRFRKACFRTRFVIEIRQSIWSI